MSGKSKAVEVGAMTPPESLTEWQRIVRDAEADPRTAAALAAYETAVGEKERQRIVDAYVKGSPPESLTAKERPARVWIDPAVSALISNADALSMSLTVFRNGPGTVNGQKALPFVDAGVCDRLEAEVRELKAKLDRQQAEVTRAVEIALDAGNRSAELEAALTAETTTAVALHHGLDLLLAQYLADNTTKLPSKTTVMELLVWSHARTQRKPAPI